ncbi:flagellar export chaperone FliS [Iodobacter fluviatilis]|jgi:flagellar protein FliS|uniref:Flagellar secretion chaperone FliS n=1 Tax=Iodobacter fluviatilis TaxID=537 RepID=A0A7G3GCV5_9NEIS|nr:flagellar export chaperone FliS [Iodobacter fluviatilis]QBC45008.1 flagellar export chaperone FliS [Iodobacter fluviatilis]
MSAVKKAISAYGQTSLDMVVESASPHQLIVLLFEGAIKAIQLGKIYMQQGLIAQKGAAISKAIAIIEDGLRLALDKENGGELAENLDSLYDYISFELLQANINNTPERLDEMLNLLGQLKDAWLSIGFSQVENETPAVVRDEQERSNLSYGRI